jgi:hypothetical protein
MKQTILYHGSIRLIKGKLIPNKAEDLEQNPSNVIKAVYATDKKDIAIGMAIISDKNVLGAGLLAYKKDKPIGKVYLGWPKQKYIYLYILDKKQFKKSIRVKNQFYSKKAIQPIKVERVKVNENLHLIKKANKREIKSWSKKYKDW